MRTVIEMAREAGGVDLQSHGWTTWVGTQSTDFLERFAELVRKDYSTTHANLWLDRIHKFMLEEREACAKVADEWAVGWPHPSTVIAERIRARSNT